LILTSGPRPSNSIRYWPSETPKPTVRRPSNGMAKTSMSSSYRHVSSGSIAIAPGCPARPAAVGVSNAGNHGNGGRSARLPASGTVAWTKQEDRPGCGTRKVQSRALPNEFCQRSMALPASRITLAVRNKSRNESASRPVSRCLQIIARGRQFRRHDWRLAPHRPRYAARRRQGKADHRCQPATAETAC